MDCTRLPEGVVHIRLLSEMTPAALAQAVNGFRKTYAADWEAWLNTPSSHRVEEFARILRKWKAVRPYTLRSTRAEAHQRAQHKPPFLDDLIGWAQPHLAAVQAVTLASIHPDRPPHRKAMRELWSIFTQLPTSHHASCVGISKAILLLTNGRIGPAFDSSVREGLGIDTIKNSGDWIDVLAQIGSDVRAFEQRWGLSLSDAVPRQYRHLELGRLYDMALGPRERGTKPRERV
jgi:hypothetical protein